MAKKAAKSNSKEKDKSKDKNKAIKTLEKLKKPVQEKKAVKENKLELKVTKLNVEKVVDKKPIEEMPPQAKPEKVVKATKSSKVKKELLAQISEMNANDATKKWLELKEKHGNEKALSYSLSGVFEAQTPIMHKLFGWGYILNNDNNRLEVLFEAGAKHLISNYKP